MDRTERLYQIERLIRHQGQASFAQLQAALEVSRATLWRDLEYLRSRLGAPIVYDRFVNGYRFETPAGTAGAPHQLPGLWFSERELYALLMAHQLLGELDGDGLIGRHLQPLRERIHDLLARRAAGGSPAIDDDLTERVRIISAARRPVPPGLFECVSQALLQRRRLHLRYLTRGRGETGERDVSPQRLVHHRGTWYLDAWCHRAQALRRFSLDAIETALPLDDAALEVPAQTLRERMDAGYGIYAGGPHHWAVLRFEAQAARWIGREQWHAQQQGRWLADGRWELRLPYANETELLMDLMRQGDEVEVVEPPSLREALRARLSRALHRIDAGATAPAPGDAPPGGGGGEPPTLSPPRSARGRRRPARPG